MARPAYMFIGIDMHDEAVMAQYREGAVPLLDRFGCRILALDDAADLLDGTYRRQRLILLAFPSMAEARGFWDSPDYAPLKRLREKGSAQDNVLVEGFSEDPPPPPGQPGERPVFLLGGSDVRDAEAMKPYYTGVPPISARYGVQVLVASNQFETLDGRWPHGQIIVLRFPSEDAFKRFWSDPEYLPYKHMREAACDGLHLMVRGL
jgi:uncharacterized protein (DUF1330 family)